MARHATSARVVAALEKRLRSRGAFSVAIANVDMAWHATTKEELEVRDWLLFCFKQFDPLLANAGIFYYAAAHA